MNCISYSFRILHLYQSATAPHIRLTMTTRTGHLAKRQVLGAALEGWLQVTCDSGLLWVTAPDSGDLLLSGGATVRVRGPGKVVLQALEPARYRLEPLAPLAAG